MGPQYFYERSQMRLESVGKMIAMFDSEFTRELHKTSLEFVSAACIDSSTIIQQSIISAYESIEPLNNYSIADSIDLINSNDISASDYLAVCKGLQSFTDEKLCEVKRTQHCRDDHFISRDENPTNKM